MRDVKVIKSIADSYTDRTIAIWECSNLDDSNENISYPSINDIPDVINEKKHPKIVQRIREAQESIVRAKKIKNAKSNGTVKFKIDNIVKESKTQVQSKKKSVKNEKIARDDR